MANGRTDDRKISQPSRSITWKALQDLGRVIVAGTAKQVWPSIVGLALPPLLAVFALGRESVFSKHPVAGWVILLGIATFGYFVAHVCTMLVLLTVRARRVRTTLGTSRFGRCCLPRWGDQWPTVKAELGPCISVRYSARRRGGIDCDARRRSALRLSLCVASLTAGTTLDS